jgi:ABC-type nitrate/sulfonate/bicarbonate transport system substrate-binding protein
MTRRRWLPGLLLAALALGWGDQAHAQARTALTFYVVSKTVGHFPFWVAERKGFYAREGLDVKLGVTGTTAAILSAVASGSVPLSAPGGSDAILAVQRGVPLVLIGGNLNAMTWTLVGQKTYTTMPSLKGQLIGVSGVADVMGTAVKAVMRTQGLEYPRDYALIQLGGTPNQWAALQKGQIAATALAIPWGRQAVDAGYSEIAWLAQHVPNFLLTVVVADRDWLARSPENRATAVRFMKAMVRTYRWLGENKDEAVAMIAEEFKFQPRYAEHAWEEYTGRVWPRDGQVSRQAIVETMAVMREFGLITAPLPDADSLSDERVVRAALQELARP